MSLFAESQSNLFGGPSPPNHSLPLRSGFDGALRILESPPLQSRLDPDGDLYLEVGEFPTVSFIVCSRTLARSSPVWNRMLNGEFLESKKPGPQDTSSKWTIKFPKDNATAMAVLLSIVHGRFDVVPSYEGPIDTKDLYDISVLTDKYLMTHALRPWARGWWRSTQCSSECPGLSIREQHCHERLWISWELGDKASFKEIANFLLLNSSASTQGADNLRCAGILEPPEIYDIIEKSRLDTIEALLTPLNNIIQGLVQNDKSFCGRSKKGRGNCLAFMLGAGIQSLHSIGLWPIPKPADIQWSVLALSVKLENVDIAASVGEYHECSQSRVLKDEIKKTLDSMPSLLTEVHHRHLEAQAKKSGISCP
ncbi:hypothetical protein HD806DRAFT_494136 [Xylariaceae sp. AK1471]|nr:hypothetical protein HD806DRAFT_494136 [Xylariaceae sp. AK1471]